MSPDTGNIPSSDKIEDTGSMKTKEVNSWFRQLVVKRMLPLSSSSPIDIGMPSIVSGIWRKIGNFSNQVIHLPILKAPNLPVLSGPIKHSNVWGRLLDLPLLRPRQRQINKNLKTSGTSTQRQIYRKKYAPTDELYNYKYSDSEDAHGKDGYEVKEQSDDSIEPYLIERSEDNQMLSEGIGKSETEPYQIYDESLLPGQIEMIKLVSEGNLFDTGYGKETIKDHIAGISQIHSAEYTNKQLDPGPASDFSKSVVQKSEKTFNNELPGLHDTGNKINNLQKRTGIQQNDLKQNKQAAEHARADYTSREPGTVFIPYYEAVDKEYIDSVPVEKDIEQIETGYTTDPSTKQQSTDIEKIVNIPVPIENKVESLKKKPDASQQNVPLTHSPSILQRAYTKIKDTMVESGVKALKLTYRKVNPSSEKTTLVRRLPSESMDSYYRKLSPEEVATPVTQDNITDEPSDINEIRPLISEDKTVIEMLSSMIDSEDKSVSPVIKSSTTTSKESDANVKPSLSMSPLVKPLVRKPSIQRIENKIGNIYSRIKKSFPFIKTAYTPELSSGDVMSRSETSLSYPDFTSSTHLTGYKGDIDTDVLEASSEQFIEDIPDKLVYPEYKGFKAQYQAPSERNLGHQIMRQQNKNKPDSRAHMPNFKALDLLFAIKEEPMRIPDTDHGIGTSLSHIQAYSVEKKQSIKEPMNLLERYLAERQASDQISNDKNKITEMAPVNSKQITGDSLSRETSISRSADESASSSTDEGIASRDSEMESLDIDSISREVYIILKRRLLRERERAFGLS